KVSQQEDRLARPTGEFGFEMVASIFLGDELNPPTHGFKLLLQIASEPVDGGLVIAGRLKFHGLLEDSEHFCLILPAIALDTGNIAGRNGHKTEMINGLSGKQNGSPVRLPFRRQSARSCIALENVYCTFTFAVER